MPAGRPKKYSSALERKTALREAINEYQRMYRKRRYRTDDKFKETLKTRRKLEAINNPIGYLITSAKARAKQKGLEFNLHPEDMHIPELCPVLGIPIKVRQEYRCRATSASIDRIDPGKGYTPDNVRIISWMANSLKKDCTDPAVFRKIADYIETNLKS